jgi:hypothetical protein
MVALKEPSPEDHLRVYDAMGPFMHCNTCMDQLPADQSPAEWASQEAGLIENGTKLVLWCKRCKKVIGIFALKYPMGHPRCDCGKSH